MQAQFETRAMDPNRREEAVPFGEQLIQFWRDQAPELNTLAWRLLTEQAYGNRFDALALEASRRSNELTEQSDWRHLETLALGLFQTGEIKGAVELQRRVLELVGDDPRRADVEKALRRFEAALPK